MVIAYTKGFSITTNRSIHYFDIPLYFLWLRISPPTLLYFPPLHRLQLRYFSLSISFLLCELYFSFQFSKFSSGCILFCPRQISIYFSSSSRSRRAPVMVRTIAERSPKPKTVMLVWNGLISLLVTTITPPKDLVRDWMKISVEIRIMSHVRGVIPTTV